MDARPGEYRNPLHLIASTASRGPMFFTRGFVPAFVRLGPHTVITFIFLEQMRLRFGVVHHASTNVGAQAPPPPDVITQLAAGSRRHSE